MDEIRAVYVTPEIGIRHLDYDFPVTYSGGLGYLGHSFARSAARMHLPVAMVSFRPRDGYYTQGVNDDGMTVQYVPHQYEGLLEEVTTLQIEIDRRPNWIKVWKVPDRYEMVPTFLLDTDIPENDYLGRLNTLQLYGGSDMTGRNARRMLAQSIVLGKGAVELMKYLEAPVERYHVNESHGFFTPLALMTDAMAGGMSIGRAIDYTRTHTVFTTHTPIAAGNPCYSLKDIVHLGGIQDPSIWDYLYHIGGGEDVNTAAICLSLASKANAVSQKHLETSKKNWSWVKNAAEMMYITNGVDPVYWAPQEFLDAATPEKLCAVKREYSHQLLDSIRKATGRFWSGNILKWIWARRFVEYKRPDLFAYDERWFDRFIRSNSAYLIVAGKPHPDDGYRIKTWNRLYGMSKKYYNLAVLPEYDMAMSRMLKTGGDVWLNNPRVPYEACATSWEGAGFVGTLIASIPDGGVAELGSDCYFRFGTSVPTGQFEQDAYDARSLRRTVRKVCHFYRQNQKEWWEMAFRARNEIVAKFNSDLMVWKYWTELYGFAE